MVAGALLAVVAASTAWATPFTVKTEPATKIGAYRAQLNGSYSGQGEGGAYSFEYGITTSYGKQTPFTLISPTNSSEWRTAAAQIEGLQPATTYHYVFGTWTNKGETSMGADRTFTTRSAPRFEAAEYYADVTAKQQASDPVLLSIEGGVLNCDEVGATGRMQTATGSLKLTPTFSVCRLGEIQEVQVSVNGCQYVLHPGDSGGPTTTMDIVCPAGQSIGVQAANCNFNIPAQTGLAPITSTHNTASTPDTITVDYDVAGVTYTKTKDGFLCPFNGTGTRTDGGLSGKQTLSAVDATGTPVDLKIGY